MAETTVGANCDVESAQFTSDDLMEFFSRYPVEKSATSAEQRLCRRKETAIEVQVQPVDENRQPVGIPFIAETHDISADGLCLYAENGVDMPYLAVEMTAPTGETRQVLMEVVRCQPCEDHVKIGCRFATD